MNLSPETRLRILDAARRHGVTNVRLFGSFARGESDPNDVDVLVDLQPGRSLFDLGGFQVELEELLRCRVDVVTARGLRSRIRDRVLREAVEL